MNIWNSIKKFLGRVIQDEAVKLAASAAKDAAEKVAVDYIEDHLKDEIKRHK
ncbi:hypothetical protein R2E40_10180 [Aeromonas sp. CD]|uniref:hypothetical protein n=1 Tax=Aeromonas sp. CD TaxID=3080830 RepID=UPI0029674EAC|nr:hypothetical protein [Aeromonas sp. CD]WOX54456.1 hypothetical protein R2E40_10180 [Aeromonas sp. CD]